MGKDSGDYCAFGEIQFLSRGEDIGNARRRNEIKDNFKTDKEKNREEIYFTGSFSFSFVSDSLLRSAGGQYGGIFGVLFCHGYLYDFYRVRR